MRLTLQRVNHASVTVDQKIVGSINKGLLLLVGFGQGDDETKLKPCAEKLINMRIFPNEQGKFHYSLLEIKGEILAVSQFTLFADTSKGRRPEFFGALEPKAASELFDKFIVELKKAGIEKVETGIFAADMKVNLENDGPVTINIEF